MKYQFNRPHRAFTLVELLVVVAIITLLAAILFPVFSRVRENARGTACLSNEKQLGMAMIQYAQDNDEKLPAGYFLSCGVGEEGLNCGIGSSLNWASLIYPYVKNRQVFACPSDPTQPASASVSVVSYIYNRNIPGYRPFGLLPAFTHPDKTILLWEVQGENNCDPTNPADNNSGVGDGRYCNASAAEATGYQGGRILTGGGGLCYYVNPANPTGVHLGGANYLLGDGHVKWLRGESVSSGDDVVGNAIPNPPKAGQDGIGVGVAAGTECTANCTATGASSVQATASRF